MRRLELLVQEVRDSSDTNDINTYSIYELMRYFNDGQKQIQKIIYTANAGTGMFHTYLDQDILPGGTVLLPTDIYAKAAINSVGFVRTNGFFSKLSKVTYAEFDSQYGYALVDNQVLVPEKNTADRIRINYVYQLPILSYRLGKVSAVNDITKVITIDVASLISDTDFTLRYDRYTIVDKNGEKRIGDLLLDELVGLDMSFDSLSDLSLVQAGDYVVCGGSGTSHSVLPDECEPFLLAYVQRRVKDKISTTDAAGEAIFTSEERSDIEDLFADNSKDLKYPPATDLDYLGV